MNKRGEFGGEKLFIYLFYLILAFMVGAILIVFAVDLRDDTAFKMKSTALDTSLLIDSVSISNDNLNIKITYEEEDFILEILNDPCLVKVLKNDRSNYVSYRCIASNIASGEAKFPFLEINKKQEQIIVK